LCSGGIDSSILLTIGHRIWTTELNRPAKDLQAFSIEFDDPKCPSRDTFYAKLLTSSLGVSHTVFKFSKQDIVDSLDDIVSVLETDDYRSVRAAIPQYFLGREISKTPYKVILSGEGADELFLGYNYFYKCPSAQDAEKESHRLVGNLHRYDVLRADRTISSWGLELRVPFLDTQFVHFVQAIEGGVRGYNVREKDLLRSSFQGLRALRITSILERNKEKFSDGCGLSYIPTLMNIVASKYVDANVVSLKSAHTLEVYEERFVKEFHANAYGKFEVQSNHEDRELPSWAEAPVENTLVGFSTKKDLRPLTVVSYEELLKNAQT
jgi:asparagine synthase (glutamine-hydrolysing)